MFAFFIVFVSCIIYANFITKPRILSNHSITDQFSARMKPLSSDFVVSQPALATAGVSVSTYNCGGCKSQRKSYSYSLGGIRRRRFVLATTVVAISLLASTTPACLVSAFAAVASLSTARVPPSLSSSRLSASKGNNKNLSSSDRERRDADRRRKERKDDVVIGKTSAKRDAVDYPINPEATEQEYLRKASKEERLVHQFTDEGMNAMKSLRLGLANKCFDKVFEVRPNAYLWQAGIVKFYLNDMKGAADIFARSASYYETKFGPMGMGPASEERIWRNASEMKYFYSLSKNARKQFLLDKQEGNSPIAQIPDDESGDGDDVDESRMGTETRLVHRLARELFDASVDQKIPIEVVARAKLLSFAGNDGKQPTLSSSRSGQSQDIKKRKLNACYFLALHYDVTGDKEESKKWIKVAFKLCINAGKSSDIMDTLPLLHMTVRDWFDDDPYDDDDEDFIGLDDFFAQGGALGMDDFGIDDRTSNTNNNAGGSSTTTTTKNPEGKPTPSGTTEQHEQQHNNNNKNSKHMSDAYSDPVLEASIMEDVGKMKFVEIREALRIRGISATGSKETLKERLFISLMDDAGYQSGFSP